MRMAPYNRRIARRDALKEIRLSREVTGRQAAAVAKLAPRAK